ncbi:MAG: sensor histidine kinase [Nitrospirales bacterium]
MVPTRILRQAEARLLATKRDVATMPVKNVQRLVYQLQVHQIELEMQNEELRRTQVELEAARASYVDLYDFSLAGHLTLDTQGTIVEANLRVGVLLGINRKELIGRPLAHFIARDDQDTFHRHYQDALKTGTRQICEVQLREETGAARWVYFESLAVHDKPGRITHWRTALLDITERKRAEEVMRESEQRFHTMADTVPALIWMAGPDKLRTYFNKGWLDYTGRTMEQELGNGWAEDLHPEDVARCLKTYGEAFDRREPFEMEYRLRKADGQYGWFLAKGVPRWFPSRAFAGYIGICIDLSERKNLEDQLRKTVKEKESLLREVHHRVKNNLQVISSLLNLQVASIKDPQVVQLFRECQTRIASIALLHETLHRSNDLSCIRMSDYLRTLAGHVFRSYGVDPKVIGLDLLVEDLAFDIDTAMTCGMIVEELLSNSLKHAYAVGTGGRIWIKLQAQDEGAYLLQVNDDGVGMSKDGGQRNSGSLGLELVNLLVEKLEGAVELQSGPGTAWRIEFHQLHYQERI